MPSLKPTGKAMAVDPEKIQQLVDAISNVIVEELEGNPTSHSEVVSALFTLLDRILLAIKKLPQSEEKIYNATIINQALVSLMIDIGKPN